MEKTTIEGPGTTTTTASLKPVGYVVAHLKGEEKVSMAVFEEHACDCDESCACKTKKV